MNDAAQQPPDSTLWETPLYFFEAVDRVFDLTLDVCADAHNTKCETYYDVETNGLTQPWDERCWMNPPFAEGGTWARKAQREVCVHGNADLVVGLVLNSTDTNWWHDCVMGRAAYVWLVNGRIPFEYRGATFGQNRYSNAVVLWERGARHGRTRFASVDAQHPRF